MSDGAPLVDVLVVNYGTADLVHRAVACVEGPGARVLTWDNSGDLLADPRGLTVLGDGTNAYFADANNALFALGEAPWVLLLNPDVELSHVGLCELVAFLETRPTAWGVAPRLLDPDGSDQRYLHALPTLPMLLVDRLPFLRRLLPRVHRTYRQLDVDLRATQVVEQPPAACLLVRRSAAGERLLDPAYRLFFNDTDLARRLNRTGECWYVGSVTARHLRNASFARLTPSYRTAREYDRALLRYARANVPRWWVLVPVVVGRAVVSWLLDTLRQVRRSQGRR